MSIQQPSSFIDWLKLLIVVLAVCGVVWVFVGVVGVTVPVWVYHLLMILGAALLALWIINILAGQANSS